MALCKNCGVGSDPERGLYLVTYHIVPVKAGGSDESSNLMCLCSKCYAEEEWKRIQGERSAKRWAKSGVIGEPRLPGME